MRFCGSTARTTSAKISVGIDIIRSLKRERTVSIRPRETAAVKLRMTPSEKEMTVAADETISVVRAP
ncbi:hypothetical protein D3C87_2140490 [compost metagenome]